MVASWQIIAEEKQILVCNCNISHFYNILLKISSLLDMMLWQAISSWWFEFAGWLTVMVILWQSWYFYDQGQAWPWLWSIMTILNVRVMVTSQDTEIFEPVIVSNIKSKHIIFLRLKPWEHMGLIVLLLQLQVYIYIYKHDSKWNQVISFTIPCCWCGYEAGHALK